MFYVLSEYAACVCECCVTDVLAADRQLAIEIEYDLRKFEEQQKEQQKQQKSSNVAVS